MLQIEPHKNYNIKLLPNINNLNKSIITAKCSVDATRQPIFMNFCYAIVNDEVVVLKFNNILRKYIQACINGFYGTSESYFICDQDEDKPTEYFSDINKSIISLKRSEKTTYKHEDIVSYVHINLLDVKSKFNLMFDTTEIHDFLKFDNIRMIESEPLYKDGDDKTKILDLYKNVENLEEVANNYKEEMISKNINCVINL